MICFSRLMSVMRAARTGIIDISWVSGTLQQQRLRYTKHFVLQGLLRILKGDAAKREKCNNDLRERERERERGRGRKE